MRYKSALHHFCLIAVILMITGCGNFKKNIHYYAPTVFYANDLVKIEEVTDATNAAHEIDVEVYMKSALELAFKGYASELNNKKGTVLNPEPKQYLLDTQVIEYIPGNAFKRWLLPGYGSTVLNIECTVSDPDTEMVYGTVNVRRTVSWGGAYTVGAWQSIFSTVAEDVRKELFSQKKK